MDNYIEVSGIGADFRAKKLSTQAYNVMDVEASGDDEIRFDSQWRPPLQFVSRLSKEQYLGQDVVYTYVNEGSGFIENQLRLRDGQITGSRSRYNEGENPEPFADWEAVSETESKEMLDKVQMLDRREQRMYQAAALCGGEQSEDAIGKGLADEFCV